MKANVLIIHGAGVRSYRIMSEKWVPYIKKQLGPEYNIVCPQMPNPQFPQYEQWREKIENTIAKLKGPLILVGHSLGGTLLLKYLTEEEIHNQVLGMYFVASPYFSESKGWNYGDFFIHKSPDTILGDFPIYSYHSTDDPIVPVSHQGHFANLFKNAVVRTLSGHGHEYNMKEFKEIIEDIKSLDLGTGLHHVLEP